MKQLLLRRVAQHIHCLESSHALQNEPGLLVDLGKTVDMMFQLAPLLPSSDALHDCLQQMQECIKILTDSDRTIDIGQNFNHLPLEPTKICGNRGRPSYDIPSETLQYWVSNGFKYPIIAEMLGVSLSTVKRKMKQYDIYISQRYSTLTDEELNSEVKKILENVPSSIGYRSVKAHLAARRIHVQEARVRKAMHMIDPEAVLIRRLCLKVTSRRKYNVRAPQVICC